MEEYKIPSAMTPRSIITKKYQSTKQPEANNGKHRPHSSDKATSPRGDAPVYPLDAFFSKLEALMEKMLKEEEDVKQSIVRKRQAV